MTDEIKPQEPTKRMEREVKKTEWTEREVAPVEWTEREIGGEKPNDPPTPAKP